MSTEPSQELDFETADFQEQGQASATCAVCSSPIVTSYWEANGQLVCERCRFALEQEFGGEVSPALYVRAALLGGGAALLGAIGWLAIADFTGYELGIIAIAIGWLVGKAVSIGMKRRGGTPAQAMAVGLTYVAIIPQYLIIEFLSEGGLDAGFLAAFGRALIGPFTEGVSNILGLAIMGFGLWQAWQTSAPVTLEIKGPFRLNQQVEVEGVG